MRARLNASRDGKAWSWAIVAPHAAPAVAYPKWAGPGFDFTVGAGDGPDVAELAIASVPGGYDAVRAHGFADFVALVAGSSGRIAVELYTAPAPL